MNNDSHSVFDREKGLLFGCLQKGEDLLMGLARHCANHQITSGFINCMGSLETVCFIHGKSDENGNPTYSEEKHLQGAIELLSGTGVIALDEKGEIDIHFHGLVVAETGEIFGGHFLKGKNPVLVTMEFMIQTSESIEASRTFNPAVGFRLTSFKSGVRGEG